MTDIATAVTGERTRSTAMRSWPAAWWVRFALGTVHLLVVVSLSAYAAHETPFNPDDPAYLRRQYVWFQSQDSARQQQLRRLHAEFVDLPAEEQARLTRVVQTYNAWLAHLPETDRRRVVDAPSTAERLEVVKQLREREWVDSLPRPYREEYAHLEGDARRHRVAEWRTEEVERREEWALAHAHWAANPGGKIPPMFLNDGRDLFETFVGHLRENLSEGERKELGEARLAADDFGNYFWYAREVVRLADLHPILPGKVGPKDWSGLPAEVRDYLTRKDSHFRKKPGVLPGEQLKELRRSQGRWPDFAVELSRYCQKNDLKLPIPLGDCRKDDMPVEVRQFLDKALEPQLKKTEQGRADLEALNKAQGSWPDYPRLILDLARKQKLPVPGWTLPGPAQPWDKLRPGKARLK